MQVRPFLCRNTVVAPLLIIALSVSGARGLITAHALRPIATSCSTIAQVRRHQNAGAFWGQPHSWLAGKTTATATRMTAGPGPGGAAAAVVARLGVTTTAFLLRGGGGGIGEHDVISAVLSELANIRTPAALLGGAALGTIFVGPNKTANKRLHLLYTALSTTAFALQLVCVLCSTLTCTAVSSQGEVIATSAIGFLSENMQFEFYVIRASFIYGLFSFLGALIARGWLTYSSDKDQGSARIIMTILAGSGFFLLNFLHHTHNTLTLCLGGMTKRLFWLGLRTMYPTWRRFFRHLSWILATWAAVKVLKLGPNQGGDQDKTRSTSTTAVSTETPGS